MQISSLTKNVIYSIFLSCITLFSNSLYAQSNSNSNGLTVEGKAIMKVKPDLSVITLNIVQRDSLENKAINKLNEQNNNLIKLLNGLEIKKDQIRIGDYSISSERNYLPNSPNESYLVHVSRNNLIIEIPSNMKVIDTFYKKMADSDFSEVGIQIEHKISKELEVSLRNTLSKMAIEDAKAQANSIISNLNAKLGPVITVYKGNANVAAERNSRKEIAPELYIPKPMSNDIAPSPFASLELNEIEIEERITLVFQIN
ncbi:SIMPL domain-containing protein [Aquirufa sp. ROCK2-A2]